MGLKLISDVNKFNIYAWLVKKLGREEKEQFIQSHSGGTAIREWKGGKILLARNVEISFSGFKMIYKFL